MEISQLTMIIEWSNQELTTQRQLDHRWYKVEFCQRTSQKRRFPPNSYRKGQLMRLGQLLSQEYHILILEPILKDQAQGKPLRAQQVLRTKVIRLILEAVQVRKIKQALLRIKKIVSFIIQLQLRAQSSRQRIRLTSDLLISRGNFKLTFNNSSSSETRIHPGQQPQKRDVGLHSGSIRLRWQLTHEISQVH